MHLHLLHANFISSWLPRFPIYFTMTIIYIQILFTFIHLTPRKSTYIFIIREVKQALWTPYVTGSSNQELKTNYSLGVVVQRTLLNLPNAPLTERSVYLSKLAKLMFLVFFGNTIWALIHIIQHTKSKLNEWFVHWCIRALFKLTFNSFTKWKRGLEKKSVHS